MLQSQNDHDGGSGGLGRQGYNAVVAVLSRLVCGPTLIHFAWLRPAYHLAAYWLWATRSHRGLTPHRIKEQIVRGYARHHGLRAFVETGTYLGDMVWALRRDFDELHTVELDHALYERARRRFAKYRHVHTYYGDSAQLLPDILARVKGPAVFWLDSHFSGGITARGEQTTPIRTELRYVLGTDQPHVILIDDARMFTGDDDYPSVDELRRQVNAASGDLALTIGEDVIRISP